MLLPISVLPFLDIYFLLCILYILSRCIAKIMNLEKPKRLIINLG
jgi:hypothetical protein